MSNDTIREALTLPPEAGSWLLKAWGETEWPAVLIATSEAQVRAFIVAEWLGDARDLDNVMDDIIGHDFKDDGPWVAEFEIGGLSIEPAYESAAAERALSQAPQAPAAQPSGESAQAESDALFGFRRDDLQDIADGLDAYERTVNVGNVTGDGDELVESTTAAAARFIRAALKQQQEKQG